MQNLFALHVLLGRKQSHDLVTSRLHLVEEAVGTILFSMFDTNLQSLRVGQFLFPDFNLLIVGAFDEINCVVTLETLIFSGLLKLWHSFLRLLLLLRLVFN